MSGSEKTPHHIIKDIGKKLADDISEIMKRNLCHVGNADAQFAVSVYGNSTAIAWSGAALAEMTGGNPGEVADALWDFLRPLVIDGIEHGAALERKRA